MLTVFFALFFFFSQFKKKPRGFESPLFYLDVSKVKSARPGVCSKRQPVALAYRNRQRDAAGTRRHLSNSNSKLLRKEGRGARQAGTLPFSPSCHPFHIPGSQSQRIRSHPHLDKSISPTFIHFSILKSTQICSEIGNRSRR